MSDVVDLWPVLLSCRQIDAVDEQLAQALGLDPLKHKSAGLVTCDQDDSMYIALDHATKLARVDVVFAKSFYAGSKHASGPFSGEILGIVAGADPDEVSEGLFALREHLRVVRFQTFAGDRVQAAGAPAFLAHVVTETGTYLSAQAGIKSGDALGYFIAPPLESVMAVDAALKVAGVRLAKLIEPPSETNFGGAFLAGSIASLEAARDAFVDAVRDVMLQPLASARRPDRLRR
ncbi:MAG TPA: ethanolamine utilization microcompartment protein EutL [Myxococcota bacterium]|jgi:ethanolamine utilization protein EutL